VRQPVDGVVRDGRIDAHRLVPGEERDQIGIGFGFQHRVDPSKITGCASRASGCFVGRHGWVGNHIYPVTARRLTLVPDPT
jgi:hypothetical protein